MPSHPEQVLPARRELPERSHRVQALRVQPVLAPVRRVQSHQVRALPARWLPQAQPALAVPFQNRVRRQSRR